MDIVNWDFLKKGLLIKNTLENPDDLILVAANTTYKKRGDLFQTYAIPASALGGGGGGGGVSLVNTAGLISGGPINNTGTITTSMATNKLVGRYTAGSGIMQEITLGPTLSLSAGGVLNAATVPVEGVLLQTNDTDNADQTILDLTSGEGIDVAYSAGGTVTFSTTSAVPQTVSLLSDVTKTSTSVPSRYVYSDVTGLTFPVVAGRTYSFRFTIFFTIISTNPLVNATGIGSGWSLNGPTFSNLRYHLLFSGTSLASLTPIAQTLYDQYAGTGSTAQASGGIAIIDGTITPSADGILAPRFRTDPALYPNIAINAKAGSYVTYVSSI